MKYYVVIIYNNVFAHIIYFQMSYCKKFAIFIFVNIILLQFIFIEILTLFDYIYGEIMIL